MKPPLHLYADGTFDVGPFENQVLYRMCSDYPKHIDTRIVAGKVIAIGRIYAASPERLTTKWQNKGITIFEAIAKNLVTKSFDDMLNAVSDYDPSHSRSTFETAVKAHKALVTAISEVLSGDEYAAKDGTSFASKYLHFHRPNSFPIMDSFAKHGLKCLGLTSSINDYEAFCNSVSNYIDKLTEPWTLRSIDTNLVKVGKEHSTKSCKCVRRKAKASSA